VPFLATGGGHGYTWSLGQLQNAIEVDLGNFQTIEIDTAANTMTIGGAVRIANVTHDLHAVGKEFRKSSRLSFPYPVTVTAEVPMSVP
jgi:hypothetical protein